MDKFDYIIIGAGSAGCVLANRLSKDPANKVLLLEAGGPDKMMEIKIPLAYGNLHHSKVDWEFSTEPQPALNNRRIYLPRGKTLGGCSSTNAMIYVRGNPADYDEWESLGNKGWAFRDLLPYFKKSEHNEDFHDEYHGQNGPLNITRARQFRTPFAGAFIKACAQSGIPENTDYNGSSQSGAGLGQFSIKGGKRHSASVAFLRPVLNRPNLTVITHATVRQILIENGRAAGVEYAMDKNTLRKVSARKEVILSAGSFQSPQLLMLSGIGAPEELTKLGIGVKTALAGVGKNLQDHLMFPVSCLSVTQEGFNHHLKPRNQLADLLQYLFTKRGVLTCSPLEATAFFTVNGAKSVNFQFHFTPLHVGNDYIADVYNPKTFPTIDGYSILPTLLKPRSRGYVGLKSSDPNDAPLIQPNFLSDPKDLQTFLTGTQKALEVINAKAFAPYRKSLIAPVDLSEKSITDHLIRSVETVYHPVGTCKMGNDPMAVVNDRLQVHGIEGLRVIDASVMPTIIAANTNAAAIMIGEKGADMVLGK